jgi:phenylacetate-CoA ligase
MHIDMERAILEVVDEGGKQVIGKPGRILATSLYNFAFPFIRYDTGDIGVMSYSKCACGRELPLLKELVGRTTDVLELNGKRIGSPVLTVLLGKFDIEQYQIIQEAKGFLTFRIVKGKSYSQDDEEFIRKSLISHLGPVEMVFDYVPSITPEHGNKHKFIIRKGFGDPQ